MSKRVATSSKVFASDQQESYEVQKIVNHRTFNGKKEYKVIWAGYSFEEATWQPEENLKCPDKIREFQKRYEDVIKKKKLMSTSPQPNTSNASQQKQPEPQRQRSPVPQKIIQERPQPPQQQKLPVNPATVLNRERLQASMEKNNLLPPKKPAEIETLKSKIMNPQPTPILKVSPDQLKIHLPTIQQNQPRQVVNTADLFTSPKTSINLSNEMKLNSSKDSLNGSVELSNGNIHAAKMIKTQTLLQKAENLERNSVPKIEDRHEDRNWINITQKLQQNESANDRRNLQRDASFELIDRRNSEERKISNYCDSDTMEIEENSFENTEDSNNFMRVSERMDIEKILGVSEQGFEVERGSSEVTGGLKNGPEFLLVKNKFNEKEKWVEKERVIVEEPMKLIEYYESLLMETMGQ